MTRRLLRHNPVTGENVWFNYTHHTGETTITHEQDVSESLKKAAHFRADKGFSDRGIKRDLWHYAHLPNIIQIMMRDKHGVDVFNLNHWPAVLKLLNTDYKAFKMTAGHHSERG